MIRWSAQKTGKAEFSLYPGTDIESCSHQAATILTFSAEDMGLEPTTGKPGNTVPVCLLAIRLSSRTHNRTPTSIVIKADMAGRQVTFLLLAGCYRHHSG